MLVEVAFAILGDRNHPTVQSSSLRRGASFLAVWTGVMIPRERLDVWRAECL